MAGLLEREKELARIEHVLREGRAGRGGALVFWGPAGIGKSSLLAAARVSAEGAGTRILRARGGEIEREYGFGVVRQLFEPVLAAASAAERADWLDGARGPGSTAAWSAGCAYGTGHSGWGGRRQVEASRALDRAHPG